MQLQVNQRLYLVSLLESSDLQRSSLHLSFNAYLLSKLLGKSATSDALMILNKV